ncbi:PQQ-dependent sugar dehydrogenase [Acetobacteraceae bacterium H6797]|nr:PQQ-dependent sugar dehydrogenase [Acetobacteraceae bacterium H6797]
MKIFVTSAICLALAPAMLASGLPASAQAQTAPQPPSINAGDRRPAATRPFEIAEVARFDTPWAMAFLPDGRMLITEKPGRAFLVTQQGEKIQLANIPQVAASGQNGLLDIALSPRFAEDRQVYLTYVAPGQGGSVLTLATARFVEGQGRAGLEGLRVIWRQTPAGGRGQPGGIIAFAPDGRHLFLTVGDRMEPETAQVPDQARGKVLRLNLDGSTPADNPQASAGGVRGQTWTTGHRNPYGLAFDPAGKLWLTEMGPRGGDELNLIQPGRNYGWGEVSNGDNYSGVPIPRHATRPEFTPPVVYWTPVISPGGMAFYDGPLFPAWRGSALIGGLSSRALIRIVFDANGGADEAERWSLGARIRDVAVAPDGAVWVIEDASQGRLMRLTPAS